jgi:ATP-dependent RNA helicase SUPV3L1/SUV3
LGTSLNGSLQNIKSGDAIITFSRKDIIRIKQLLETKTKKRAAVIYGALPPGKLLFRKFDFGCLS